MRELGLRDGVAEKVRFDETRVRRLLPARPRDAESIALTTCYEDIARYDGSGGRRAETHA